MVPAPAKSFKDLLVWQKAHALVLATYRYTRNFPECERYGLSNQFRRAVVSVAANIAEGFVKRSPRDKLRIMNIAQGSLEESKYYALLSFDLGYGSNIEIQDLADQDGKLLNAYMRSIKGNHRRETN